MNLSNTLLPSYVLWMADLLYLVLLGLAIRSAPWKRLQHSEMLHVFLGSCVALLMIWSMKAGITPGLTYHLLGGTLLVLMFGRQLAFIAISLVLVGVTYYTGGDWQALPVNALMMGGIPIMVTYGVYLLSLRFLPHHFFVYVLFNAYFCGGLTMALTVFSSSILLVCCGPYSLAKLAQDYLPFAPFMIFAEGFFSGMLATGMALMRPEWIWSFDDRRYLAGK